MREKLKAAVRSQDISLIVKLIARSQILTPAEYIRRTLGTVMFLYYSFIDAFHRDPLDFDDLVDGLLFIDAKNYMQQQALKGRS